MILSKNETERLINFVLDRPADTARREFHQELTQGNYSEAELATSITVHGSDLVYDGDQWFDFMGKIPNFLLKREQWLVGKLTPTQRQELGIKS